MKVEISEELENVLIKLSRMDSGLFRAVQKKINQIAVLDECEIEHFKNLRGELSDHKRVHVGSFVLFFKLDGDYIIFDRLEHHDKAY